MLVFLEQFGTVYSKPIDIVTWNQTINIIQKMM
jgi:hypothetical protein